MKVIITVFCSDEKMLKGSLLVFDSLRVGYPSWDVEVWFCGKLGRKEVQEACEKTKSLFKDLGEDRILCGWIVDAVVNSNSGGVIFVDTDIVFWSECESFKQSSLLAGSFIPRHKDAHTKTVTKERLHTSHLWIRSCDELKQKLSEVYENNIFTPFNAFYPFIAFNSSTQSPVFFDTCANLYCALGGEHFSEAMKDRFDHIFCGTHIDRVSKDFPGLAKIHEEVYQDVSKAKGLYKLYDNYFKSCRC